MTIRLSLATVGCCVAATMLVRAQVPAETFQFVSVRKVASDCQGRSCTPTAFAPVLPSSMRVLPDGRFEARAATVEALARVAYGFEFPDPRRGVVDGTRIPQDRFDITAVADRAWAKPRPGETMPAELRPMLRALLEERFQLETRVEDKKIGVYALRLTNRDGKPGPGLRPSANTCLGPFAQSPSDDTGTARCPFRADRTGLDASAVTMAEVARLLARLSFGYADRLIVDQTGLGGTYDVTLSLTASRPYLSPSSVSESGGAAPGFIVPEIPSASPPLVGPMIPPAELANAMTRQLGLRIDRTSVPLPTLILARMKAPVED